ncbi:hypothetical protein Pelo_16543 [Pelomyxa schiedti]|nr:hypothetical protein Pelo_16543 [Pelomyxa schiedti]
MWQTGDVQCIRGLYAVDQCLAMTTAFQTRRRRINNPCLIVTLPERVVWEEIVQKWVLKVSKVVIVNCVIPGEEPAGSAPPVIFSLSHTGGLVGRPVTVRWVDRVIGWIGRDRALVRRRGADRGPTMSVVDSGARQIGEPVELPFEGKCQLVACNARWVVMSPPELDLVVWAVVNGVPAERCLVLNLSKTKVNVLSLRLAPSGIYDEESDTLEVVFYENGEEGLVLCAYNVDLNTVWENRGRTYNRSLDHSAVGYS